MNQFLRLLSIGFFSLLILNSCGNSHQQLIDEAPLISQVYKDDMGREVRLKRPPTRVSSLAPNITEMIFAIGAQDKLVSVSHACNFPPEAAKLPDVLTYPDLDLPGLVEYEPDLILSTNEIHNEKILAHFDKLGLPLYFQNYDKIDDIYRNILNLGKMLGREENAARLVDSLKTIEQRIADSTAGQIDYSTMVVVSVDPIIVAGGGSFINEMIVKAGGKNAFGDIQEKYPTVTEEAVLKAAPEYIILPSRNDQIYSELISLHPAIHLNVPAAVENRVLIVNPDLFFRPGPRTMEGLIELTRILHARINTGDILE